MEVLLDMRGMTEDDDEQQEEEVGVWSPKT